MQPMLCAKSRTSRFSHEASCTGYSKPTPGPLMFTIVFFLARSLPRSTGSETQEEMKWGQSKMQSRTHAGIVNACTEVVGH